jgi:photosystem II stability/assembly factor-like uncharacterized protein
MRMRLRWLILASAGLLALAFAARAQDILPLRHAHGLGYSADGARIMIPGHQGIMVYGGKRWSIAPGPARDYMGFAVTRRLIFSSGHFAPGGARGTSLGLLRSGDGGRSWASLGFEGEAEFHLVAAGYESDALYLYSSVPNSRMPRAGLYRMLNGAGGWRSVAARGVRGELFKLAVHPSDEAVVAAVTSEGLFLSRSGGEEFEPLVAGAELRTAYFPLDGDSLWFGTFDGGPALFRMALGGGAREEIALPPLRLDAVAFIAQNPMRRAEFTIVTFERAVFVTPDRGRTWTRIARARGTLPQD